ncbi:MAG TPA: hypothetical protein VJL34_09850 [Anaerolineales bacterium]|nr:hypothetical protein [Anaerolineales bacterium]
MARRTIYLGLIFGISLLISNCSRPSIQVYQAAPIEQAVREETLDMRNCDSNDDMVTTLAAQAPARQHISISELATAVETGSVIDIPNEVYNELRLQIESAHRTVFEKAVASAEKVDFTIPGHKIHMYKIHWIQQIYRSTISFAINDQACTASYVYTLEIPKLDSYTVMACTA